MKETKIFKKRKCQEILKGGFITKDEQTFLNELLKSHPNHEKKKGVGISNFFIKKTSWGNNGFFIRRIDMSETDFSYLQCLNKRTNIAKIKAACRLAIKDFVMSKSRKGYIAHHNKVSFNEIFNLWIKDKNITDLKMDDGKDNCVEIIFKDKRVSEDFKNFHNAIASVKEVSIEKHKQLHKKENDTKTT